MKQFFVAIWNFLQVLAEARAHSEAKYQLRLRGGRWDY
jgi:hypothetical protein